MAFGRRLITKYHQPKVFQYSIIFFLYDSTYYGGDVELSNALYSDDLCLNPTEVKLQFRLSCKTLFETNENKRERNGVKMN